MKKKNTDELTKILKRTHADNFQNFLDKNQADLMSEDDNFYSYFKEIARKNKLNLQTIFLLADVPERYGYKLLSGEKHTKQRDVVLRLCYAAGMNLDQTQQALKKYGMPQLYSKIARDALLMISFNERPGTINDINALLDQHGFEPLRSSGTQE